MIRVPDRGDWIRIIVRCPTCGLLDIYRATVLEVDSPHAVRVHLWRAEHMRGGPGPFGDPRPLCSNTESVVWASLIDPRKPRLPSFAYLDPITVLGSLAPRDPECGYHAT